MTRHNCLITGDLDEGRNEIFVGLCPAPELEARRTGVRPTQFIVDEGTLCGEVQQADNPWILRLRIRVSVLHRLQAVKHGVLGRA